MLEAMRNKAGTWVVRILAVFLILSFGIWGVGDMIRPKGVPDRVATVGDAEIGSQEFTRQYNAAYERLRRSLGSQVTQQQARRLGLVDRTVEALVQARLIDLTTRQMELAISDDTVRKRIVSDAAFKNEAGQFDASLFRQRLAGGGFDEATYVSLLRSQMRDGFLTSAIEAGTAVPTELLNVMHHFAQDRRVADIVVVPMPEVAVIGKPTDSQLETFYKDNPKLFTLPEARRLSLIYLDPKKAADKIAISDDQLRSEYEARRASLIVPERRKLSQIVVPDEETAKRAYTMITQGRPFADVAKEITGQDSGSLSLGLVTRKELPKDLADAAFGLEGQSVTKPIKTAFGWHIISVDEIQPGKTPSFDEAKGKIHDELALNEAIRELVPVAEKLEDVLAGGVSLADAAQELQLDLTQIPWVDANGLDANGEPVAGLPDGTEMLKQAFALQVGEPSTVTDTPNGGYYAVEVEEKMPPTAQPLAEVRDRAVAAWQATERDRRAEAAAKKMLEAAKGGDALSDLATADGLHVRISKPVTRFGDGDKDVPPLLLAELFKAKKGDAVMARVEGGFAVARVTDIQPAKTPPEDKETYASYRDRLRPAMATDLRLQFMAALRADNPVEIDHAAIDKLIGGSGGQLP